MNGILILHDGRYGHSEKTARIPENMQKRAGCLAARDAPENPDGVSKLLSVSAYGQLNSIIAEKNGM